MVKGPSHSVSITHSGQLTVIRTQGNPMSSSASVVTHMHLHTHTYRDGVREGEGKREDVNLF